MKSLAVVFPTARKVDVIEEEVPYRGARQVLCAAEKSLISIGTELQCLRGTFDTGTNWEAWVKYPFRPGYCMSGRVLEIGSEVTTVKVGQLVATQQPHRQYFVSAPEELIAVPDGVTAEDAAWVPIALTAQIGARRAALVLGESAAVVGLGMVGQMVVQYLRLMGARHLIGIDPATQRIALAERSGITHGLPVDVRKATAFAADITEERMLDVVFDATGRTDVLGPAILLVRKQGRVVLVGDTATPTQQCLGPGFLSGSVSIIGAHLSARPDQASIYAPWSYLEMTRLFFHYVQQGRMSTAHLNTPGVSVSTAPALYDSIVTDRSTTMGVFFDWAR